MGIARSSAEAAATRQSTGLNSVQKDQITTAMAEVFNMWIENACLPSLTLQRRLQACAFWRRNQVRGGHYLDCTSDEDEEEWEVPAVVPSEEDNDEDTASSSSSAVLSSSSSSSSSSTNSKKRKREEYIIPGLRFRCWFNNVFDNFPSRIFPTIMCICKSQQPLYRNSKS